MPAKHINDETWRQVEGKLVEAVVATKRSVKDADILKLLLEVGMKNVTDDDYWKMVNSKKKE